jgi:hypothetical protein
MIHLALHAFIPLTIALMFFRRYWVRAFVILMLGMLIDFDHLLANPIYDSERCSIGFHPLHTLLPIGIYIALFAHEKTRLLGLGLCVHIALDAIDCQITGGVWIHGFG